MARPQTNHPTIATIAAHMGLSRATVTHVLNGRGTEQRIRPETQQRVLEVAQELGYRANASARAVRAGRFGSVALIQSQVGQYLPVELLYGLTTAIAARDLHLVLTEVPDVDASGDSYVARAMRELSVDGVFVNRHGGAPPPYLERIRDLRIPAVFLNSKQAYDGIHPDDLSGGSMAVEYLLRLGHERIAYVETEPRYSPHYSEGDRRLGYEQAMISAGRAPRVHRLPADWRGPGSGTVDQRVEAVLELLTGLDRPTAVIAYELTESMAVVRAAHLLRLGVPRDLSLIHFHNRLDDRWFIPIHTVSNRMREVGEGAVDMLQRKIESPSEPVPTRVVPEVLLEGATCAAPRKGGSNRR
ncbi:MAG TPA: LacI family DNA-binding transcriptional regulator [Armatimonadota bacterium]|jgi:LacI family transcriptional regulator